MTAGPLSGFLLLLGLGFFFGLAFEEFYAEQERPGGIRTFPLLAVAGGLLYRLDPVRLLPLVAGLLVLGALLTCHYWRHIGEIDPDGRPNVGLMTPVCNVLAYLLGPVSFAEPPWVAIGVTVVAVLLLTARENLHGFARRLEVGEIITAGKFLVLTGVVLPFLPTEPVIALTPLTPRQVWLAVLAICTLSYASYLLQRYAAPRGHVLWAALLGGLYSSTATTIVLARRAHAEPTLLGQMQAGIVLATAIMYLRLFVIIAIFNWRIALALGPALAALAAAGLILAGLRFWALPATAPGRPEATAAPNPLELSAAFVFAFLFVAVSLASGWASSRFGAAGLFGLAAIVGAADVDPFVVNIASAGDLSVPVSIAVTAVLIAASSNNLIKAGYAVAFAGRAALLPAAELAALSLAGGAMAWWTVFMSSPG